MRCTTETEKGSGYSAYFHCDANINISKNKVGKAREDNYPEALIRFNEPQDMSAVKLNISAKFNNAHKWFAITLYNADQEAVTNEIGIDFVGSADEWLKYTINRATLFSSLVSGKSLENVQFMKVIMNFDSRDSASIQNNLPRNVWIDNIVIEEESNTIEINAGDTKTIVAGPTTFRAASQDKVDGKCLYMKFKYEGGSTSSDKVSFSLQNNPTSGGWHNVSGDLDIYGDMTTNKSNSGVIEDLEDGWKSLTMPTAYFNGNGDDRSAINLIYFKKFTGSVTKFTLNTDSVTFIDAPRDFTTTGKVVRFSSSIANWKTSGVKVVMDIEKILGDKGGERNIFSLLNSSSQTVASFTCRPVSHKLKQWGVSSEGSELPSTSSFVQKAGDVYTVTLVLNDINAMSGFDGSESVDRIEFST